MVVGIDLGTTNSVIAYIDASGNPQIIPNSEGSRIMPSVILFDGDSTVVGQTAKDNADMDPLNVVQFVKRQMGNSNYSFINSRDEVFTAEELSALILKKLKTDAEKALGERIDSAVITVPAYFNDTQRKATQDAGEIAGLNVIAIINEPTAAALAYGLSKSSEPQNVLVYDLGGGTFDVTIMHINHDDIVIKATNGIKNLGGFDFDNCIMNLVINKFKEEHGIDPMDDDCAYQELREKAENAKKALSSKNRTVISLMSQGKGIKMEITREQFEEMIKPLIDRTAVLMEMVLEDSGLEWSDIDKVLLVGGSTRIPAVQEMITRVTGKVPSHELNPDEVVANGAAYYASFLDSKEDPKVKKTKITDVNSHSLGVVAMGEDGKEYNEIILPRNTPLPSSEFKDFCTLYDDQELIKLQITEGEDEDLDYVNIIGTSLLKIKKRPKGSPIRVIIGYDTNSIIHVRVIDLIDNTDLGEMKIERNSNLSEEEIVKKKDNISKITIE